MATGQVHCCRCDGVLMIYLAPSQIHGRGVFSDVDIAPGEFHTAYTLPLDDDELKTVRLTKFERMLYACGDGRSCLALTPMTLANHSNTPNATFEVDETSATITFSALAQIRANEEITIDYGGLAVGLGLKEAPPPYQRRSYRA